MAQSIYCDEAGFSGNNLLDPNQPFFTYAAVAIEHGAAEELVRDTISRFRIDGAELKGASIVKHSRGRKAVTAVLEHCAPDALVSAWHKRYCLATKFFEYVFEPVLAEQNSIFYRAGFHRFISNILFFEALTNNHRAAKALVAFQEVVRAHDAGGVKRLFPDRIVEPGYSEVVADIQAFVEANHETIAEDIASYVRDEPLYRWLLDLSVSALFALLTTWGQRRESLTVYCDESKPLHESRETFDMMIGRTDKAEIRFEDKSQSLIFNLSGPLQFVPSVTHPGIQIADIFASALAFALRNPHESASRQWFEILDGSISEFSVFPDQERVDLASEQGFVNRVILHELVLRGKRGQDPFRGMPQFIASAEAYWRLNRPRDVSR